MKWVKIRHAKRSSYVKSVTKFNSWRALILLLNDMKFIDKNEAHRLLDKIDKKEYTP